ncbi:MAG: 50S ribosomal protein L11 methyltransferase [Ignavibacteriales bacterium]|nr:50S ribosomal protein L11 methyltransferase [Ignavibacteriales bacterium]
MKTYTEFIVKTDPFLPDLVSGVLWKLEITGISEENNFLKVYVPEQNKINKKQIEDILESIAEEKLINSYSVEENELENKNWNEEWEKSLNVIEINDRIVIKPTFRKYIPKENQIVLTIDPKMSFGTGEHQTTKLVLQTLEKYIQPGVTVLDVGTGTGILAIASVKLGAKNALAIDNDEWCYENAIENCELNSVSDKVEFRLAEIDKVVDKKFDLILANIQKNVLLDIAPEIKKCNNTSGLVILSGLLTTDEQEIISCYEKLSFRKIETIQMDEWIAIVFKN